MRKTAELSKETLQEQISLRKQELSAMLTQLEKQTEILPLGKINVTRCGNSYQYRLVDEDKSENRVYISKKNDKLIRQLVQKEYNQKIIKELRREIKALTRCLKEYQPDQLEQCYTEAYPGKQVMINPVVLPDKMYLDRWLQEEYTQKTFQEDSPEYFTDRGERVRSKSEIMIANKLYQKGIAYKYEYPLELTDGRIVHPDFCCLHMRTRREILWEHFGMMDNEEYACNAVKKLEAYAKSGYVMGYNLLATFETTQTPLSSKQLDRVIKAVFV